MWLRARKRESDPLSGSATSLNYMVRPPTFLTAATFPWIDTKSLSPGLIIVPLVSRALGGTLIGFQMELMVRVRAESRRVTVLSATKAKDDLRQDNRWDTDHDRYLGRTS